MRRELPPREEEKEEKGEEAHSSKGIIVGDRRRSGRATLAKLLVGRAICDPLLSNDSGKRASRRRRRRWRHSPRLAALYSFRETLTRPSRVRMRKRTSLLLARSQTLETPSFNPVRRGFAEKFAEKARTREDSLIARVLEMDEEMDAERNAITRLARVIYRTVLTTFGFFLVS